MQPAHFWIDHLRLAAHPEGGFYKETYRAKEGIGAQALPHRFSGSRSFSTAIFFLLRSQDRSVFHRIKSDELWHYYAGTGLAIYILTDDGVTVHKLGPNPDLGEAFQIIVPANCWFGAKVIQPDSYTLAGCTVSPGFDYEDFEFAEKDDLLANYPGARNVIEMLT